jgi:UDP-N-acetyl-D-galactosamine dehydrogenase
MADFPSLESSKVSVVGLGYIGLPLCYYLYSKTSLTVIGYDIDRKRIDNIASGMDHTGFIEATSGADDFTRNAILTSDKSDLADSDIFIITVPTPIDIHKNPDLNALISATATVKDAIESSKIGGKTSKRIIIFESTVYPLCTQEVCLPILGAGILDEKVDFEICYSPERLSPGKNSKTLPEISKVVSSNSLQCSNWLKEFYSLFIDANIHIASSIKVAEASKILENVQRDVNIALMNEVSILFNRIDIDIYEVLKMANTKWNFLPFTPGLVGGHCIGVDPYYLLYQSRRFECDMRLIESSRNINQNMTGYIARSIAKNYHRKTLASISSTRVLMLGATFKPNCSDFRNSQQIILANLLRDYGFDVDLCDYHAINQNVPNIAIEPSGFYNMIIFALRHDKYVKDLHQYIDMHSSPSPTAFIVDLQDMIPPEMSDLSL